MKVESFTTPGIGDFMMVLNRMYWLKHSKRIPIHLEFNWYHDKDYLHHFEEEETIIDRFNYLQSLYLHKSSIKISHVFNSDKHYLTENPLKWRYLNSKLDPERHMRDNIWTFRKLPYKTDMSKVVIYRPTFNAEPARDWKRIITNDQWDEAIDILKFNGYNVVELTYRSPVREAVYHIGTCNFVVGYDGMWHYVAKNFWKPMIQTSRSSITNYHTPHALRLEERSLKLENNFLWNLKHLHTIPRGKRYSIYRRMVLSRDKHQSYFLENYQHHANRSRSNRD